MAKILLVHGMRMQAYEHDGLHRLWYGTLRAELAKTAWGQAHPERLPGQKDVELVYWADLFERPDLATEAAATKGIDIKFLRSTYYALLRASVRAADWAVAHNAEGRPKEAFALLVDRMVYQAAVYMHNGPVFHPDPQAGDGAFFQVQARLRQGLKDDTRLVIGHSLGSVVAYEGLVAGGHSVRTFMTVGSPIATPKLILQPLKERLAQLFKHDVEAPPPWPGVEDWVNIYAAADVWCVPIKRLAPVFAAPIRDIEVDYGSPHDFVNTHKLTSYLERPEVSAEISKALAAIDAAEIS